MNWPGPERWQRLCQGLGTNGDPTVWYDILTRAYAEPQRHYHNQQHIADCLAEYDTARYVGEQAQNVELALWFHDAVYDPRAADNEERSAALAKQFLDECGRPDISQTVLGLVMATKLHQTTSGPDAALVVDIDLSILGQNEDRFADYESQIRKEYEWVPQEIFNTKRAEILLRFLDRSRIYSTEQFFARYERQARYNLERSIRRLRSQS